MKFGQVLDRLEVIRNLERETHAKVITFYRNANNGGGIINEQSYTSLVAVLDQMGDAQPLAIVLDSRGGLTASGSMIATRLRKHMGSLTVIVPEEAYSAATVIALAADKILCGTHANFTPVESQYKYKGNWVSILDMEKSRDGVLKAATGRVLRQTEENLKYLMGRSIREDDKVRQLIKRLLLQDGFHASHSALIPPDELKGLGAVIEAGVPRSAMALHNLYRQHDFSGDDPSTIIEYSPANWVTDEDIAQSDKIVAYYVDGVCPDCGETRLIMDNEYGGPYRRCSNCFWDEVQNPKT